MKATIHNVARENDTTSELTLNLAEGLTLLKVTPEQFHRDYEPISLSVSSETTRKGVTRLLFKAEAPASIVPPSGSCCCDGDKTNGKQTLTVHTVVTLPKGTELMSSAEGLANAALIQMLASACHAMVNGMAPKHTWTLDSDDRVMMVGQAAAKTPAPIAALALGETDAALKLIDIGNAYVTTEAAPES